jgi:hypothetical protein
MRLVNLGHSGRLLEIIGHIVFEVETVPLDQYAGAWERQRAGGVGHKLVITP